MLLSGSEKVGLTDQIVEARAEMLTSKNWNEDCEAAYGYLKGKLDPLHTYELRPYLANFPKLVGGAYLVAFMGQLFLRDLFPTVYVISVTAVVLPALFLIAGGA